MMDFQLGDYVKLKREVSSQKMVIIEIEERSPGRHIITCAWWNAGRQQYQSGTFYHVDLSPAQEVELGI